jgi:hypothetical protein
LNRTIYFFNGEMTMVMNRPDMLGIDHHGMPGV